MDDLNLKAFGLAQSIIRFAAEYKTRATLERNLERMVNNLYSGSIELPEFVDSAYSLMRGQIYQAVYKAAKVIWPNATDRANNLRSADLGWVEQMTGEQLTYIVRLGTDILEASGTDKPVDPFISRVSMWGARFDEAYNKALVMLGKHETVMEWEYGPTEHCETCLALNGQKATTYHWKLSGFVPQGKMLECGGWRCQCRFRVLSQKEVAQLTAEGWASTIPMA